MPDAIELELPDARIAGLAWGPLEGRPMLAIHGWLDNAASFTELAPRLADALGMRVVAIDLPGHGMSSHGRNHYHFIDMVADVIHAANSLGWDRFSLLGHSMGAGVSTLVAGTVPERIDRCVLLEGLGPMVDEPAQAASRLARSLRVEARKQDKHKRLFPDPQTAIDRLLEAATMKPESARHLVERGLEQRDGGWAWRADPRLRIDSRLRLSEDHVHAFLAAIRASVLLITADRGWPHDAAVAARRMAALANLSHVTLQGNHHVHLDEPDAVAAVIVPFLETAA
jgi:pimeloyl-ACP methyl ester carboxylesterase